MKKANVKTSTVIMMAAAAAAFMYIRYQRIEIEIARFDCMMKIMKEEKRQYKE